MGIALIGTAVSSGSWLAGVAGGISLLVGVFSASLSADIQAQRDTLAARDRGTWGSGGNRC